MSSHHPSPKQTPLFSLHTELGARIAPFAGYAMPVQYDGILAEHLHTRNAVSLFDVSHMGQLWLEPMRGNDPRLALQSLVCGDLVGLRDGQMRYSLLTSETGGILDDLMITAFPRGLHVTVNAARKDADVAHIKHALAGQIVIRYLPDMALLAVQGPDAEAVLVNLIPQIVELRFLSGALLSWRDGPVGVTRSGYTGEDGFEISLPASQALDFARAVLADGRCKPAGLGARDSLRLEAGLCLHGQDIDATTTPIAAGLGWTIGKNRKDGGFPGAETVLAERGQPPARKRTGFLLEGRAPIRSGADILDPVGQVVGVVTSGGFGPSVDGLIAMGYVEAEYAVPGTELVFQQKSRRVVGKTTKLPFVQPGYRRPAL